MEAADPEAFLAELLERFAQLPEGELTQLLLGLSSRDESFLSLDAGETTRTFPPIQRRFARLWPEEQPLAGDKAVALVTAARKRDRLLQKRVDRLVPKRVSERAFWRHYFSRVHAVLVRHRPSEGDVLAVQLGSLPPPRPAEQRRFQPAEPLQTEGELPRERLVQLLLGLARMVSSEESLALVARAAADGCDDVGGLMTAHQYEFIESLGIERAFGVALMSPGVLARRFPGDGQLLQILGGLQRACGQAAQVALHTGRQRAPTDAARRRFKPAADLQREGELGDARLAELVEAISGALAGPDGRAQLTAAMREGGLPAEVLLVRWQRELLEQMGVEQDFGVQQLRRLPQRHQAEAAARRAAPAAAAPAAAEGCGAEVDAALARAFGGLQAMSEALAELGREAALELRRPSAAQLRFQSRGAAEGGLQADGTLSRAQLLAFCTGAAQWLQADESAELLARVDEAASGPLSIAWQRQFLEHLGIEQVSAAPSLGRRAAACDAEPRLASHPERPPRRCLWARSGVWLPAARGRARALPG